MAEDIGLFEAMYTQRARATSIPPRSPTRSSVKFWTPALAPPTGQSTAVALHRHQTPGNEALDSRALPHHRPSGTRPSPERARGSERREKRRRRRAPGYASHEAPVLILCCVEHDGSPSDARHGESRHRLACERQSLSTHARSRDPGERPHGGHPSACERASTSS